MSNLDRSLLRFTQPLVYILITLVGILIVIGLQIPQLKAIKDRDSRLSPQALAQEDELTKYRLNVLHKAPTFGFDNLVADWAFLEFAGYFGDEEAREIAGYELSPDYFEVIVEKDPRFQQAYPFLFSGGAYANAPEKTVELMEKGLQSMTPEVPDKSYYVWRYKAFTELLFLDDSQAAQKSYEQAAEWASIYSDPISQNVALISRRTAQFLADKPDSNFAQIGSWLGVLETAVDERTRENAIKKIQELGGEVQISPEGTIRVNLPEEE